MAPILIAIFFFTNAMAEVDNLPSFPRRWCGAAYEDLYTKPYPRFSATRARYHLLKKLKTPIDFQVSGKTYTAHYTLGASSSTVYLGKDLNGKLVSIKKFPTSRQGQNEFWIKIAKQEAAKTQVLSSLGESTPQVIAADLENGILVKEYVSGLQLQEMRILQRSLGLSDNLLKKLEQELKAEMARLKNRDAAVSAGLNDLKMGSNNPILGDLKDTLVYPLDLKEHNFIYDFSHRKWILFDP